jgi:hypothetical protein
MIQRSVAEEDPEPKAISCYGLYLPRIGSEMWLRERGSPLSCLLCLDSPISSTRGFIFSPGWDLEAYSTCSPRLNLRPSCSSPSQVIQAICHSREPQWSKPRLEAGRRRGTRMTCEVPGVLSTRRVTDALRSHPRGYQRE